MAKTPLSCSVRWKRAMPFFPVLVYGAPSHGLNGLRKGSWRVARQSGRGRVPVPLQAKAAEGCTTHMRFTCTHCVPRLWQKSDSARAATASSLMPCSSVYSSVTRASRLTLVRSSFSAGALRWMAAAEATGVRGVLQSQWCYSVLTDVLFDGFFELCKGPLVIHAHDS